MIASFNCFIEFGFVYPIVGAVSYTHLTKRYLGLRQEELLNTYDCLSF